MQYPLYDRRSKEWERIGDFNWLLAITAVIKKTKWGGVGWDVIALRLETAHW